MHHNDPADMSIDERLDEVASLLAAGYLRLKRRTGCLPLTGEQSSNWPHAKGLPPDASPSPNSATYESADSSKTSPESTCHLSETPPLCDPR